MLELCIHAFERVCFVPLSDSSLCFVSCALEFMFCGLLCCVPSVFQAFVLWTFEKETSGCEFLVCVLSIWELNIMCYEFLKKTLGLIKVWLCEWFKVWGFHIPPPSTLFTICNFFAFCTSHACCYRSYRVCYLLLPLEFLFVVYWFSS